MYSEKNEDLQHKMTEMGESNRVITQVRMRLSLSCISGGIGILSLRYYAGHALEARGVEWNKCKIRQFSERVAFITRRKQVHEMN